MKKLFFLLLVIVMIGTAVFGCTKSEPSPAQVIELKYYTNFPPDTGPSKEGQIFADVVSKASNGRIKITVYPAEQLGKASATLDLLKSGATDMAALSNPMFPTVFPLQNLQELALAVVPDWVTATKVRDELTLGGYLQGFDDLKFLGWNTLRPMYFWLKKKVVKAEDFNGLKLRTPNPVQLAPFQQFGVTTVAMPMGDVYMSLERGVIDGALNPPENAMANKWYEITKFGLAQPIAYGSTSMVISKSKWDSLPADIRQIIEKAVSEWRSQTTKYYQDYEKSAIDTMTKAGVEIYKLDSAEVARWKGLEKPVIDSEAARIETSTGLPAKAMVEKLNQIASKDTK